MTLNHKEDVCRILWGAFANLIDKHPEMTLSQRTDYIYDSLINAGYVIQKKVKPLFATDSEYLASDMAKSDIDIQPHSKSEPTHPSVEPIEIKKENYKITSVTVNNIKFIPEQPDVLDELKENIRSINSMLINHERRLRSIETELNELKSKA